MSKLTIFAKFPKVKCAQKCIFLSNAPSFSWLKLVGNMVHDPNQHPHIICFIIHFILIFLFIKSWIKSNKVQKIQKIYFDMIFWQESNPINLWWPSKIVQRWIDSNWHDFCWIWEDMMQKKSKSNLHDFKRLELFLLP